MKNCRNKLVCFEIFDIFDISRLHDDHGHQTFTHMITIKVSSSFRINGNRSRSKLFNLSDFKLKLTKCH